MNRQKWFALAAVIVAVGAVAWEWKALHATAAQDKENLRKQLTAMGRPGRFGDSGQRQAWMLDRMGQELNLTAAQKAQIRSIQEDQARKTGAIFENRSLSREQRREQMRQARAEADAQVKAALNPDQQMKFDEMQTRQRAWMEAMRGGRMGGFPPGRPMGGPPPGGMRPPDSPLPGGMPPSGEPGGRNQ